MPPEAISFTDGLFFYWELLLILAIPAFAAFANCTIAQFNYYQLLNGASPLKPNHGTNNGKKKFMKK